MSSWAPFRFSVPLLLLSRVWGVRAQTNLCINPPSSGPSGDYLHNDIVSVGDTLNVAWSSDFHSINLILYQNNDTGTDFLTSQIATDLTGVSSFAWQVDVSTVFNSIYPVSPHNPQNVFFFWLENSANTAEEFTCHYFNITPGFSSTSALSAPPGSMTSSNGGSTASSLASSGTSRLTSSSSSSPLSSSSSSSSSGLSEGGKIGIGVGIGVGICGIAIGAIIGFCLRRRAHDRSVQHNISSQVWQANTTENENSGQQSIYNQRPSPTFLDQQPHLAELETQDQPREMLAMQAEPHELHSGPQTLARK